MHFHRQELLAYPSHGRAPSPAQSESTSLHTTRRLPTSSAPIPSQCPAIATIGVLKCVTYRTCHQVQEYKSRISYFALPSLFSTKCKCVELDTFRNRQFDRLPLCKCIIRNNMI